MSNFVVILSILSAIPRPTKTSGVPLFIVGVPSRLRDGDVVAQLSEGDHTKPVLSFLLR